MNALGARKAPEMEFGRTCIAAGARRSVCAFLIVVLSIGLIGCRTLGLPAIDPSGQRIFLPSPNRTEINRDILPGNDGLIPNPAFPTPVSPPPCIQGTTAPNVQPVGTGLLAKHDRGNCGQLMMTPTKIVAPVGGEVLLLAGICGEDGYFVTKEPIEWMLTPESVGTFIEVGDDAKGKALRSWHAKPKVEKLDVDFAKGRTSSIESAITRGTANPKDDLPLRKGQTWITLSSPVEGVSRVTALAPDSELWDKRRQTAVIYWLDAQWAFPSPAMADSGQPVTLSTTVTRSRDAAVAAEDWVVKYRILNPEVARFLPSGAEVAEARVGKDSRASVQVQQVSNLPGTAIIAIEVERPADATDNMPALPLGRGQTTVTWSSAQLLLQPSGPATVTPGEIASYSVQLGNTGDVQATNVVLQANIPAGAEVVDVVPPPDSRTDRAIQWNIGTIPAQQQFVGNVQLRMLGPGASVISFQAVGSSGSQTAPTLNIEKSIRTELIQPSMRLRIAPENNATTVEVGQRVKFLIDVENNGTKTLENIILDLTSSPGLQEVESGSTTLSKPIGHLGPQQRNTFGIVFNVTQAGDLVAEVKGRLGSSPTQAVLAQNSAAIRAVQPVPKRPGLTIKISPKDNRTRVAANGRFVVVTEVQNTGEVPLSDVQIALQYSQELSVVGAPSASDVPSQRKLLWRFPSLQPAVGGGLPGSITVEAEFLADRFGGQGIIEASVVTTEQVAASDRLAITVDTANPVLPPDAGGPGTPPVLPGNPVLPGRAGNWKLQIRELTEPAVVGQDARYEIAVLNDQNLIDQNLVLEIRVSDEAEITKVAAVGTALDNRFIDARHVRSDPVREVRAGETVRWNLSVRPRIPGRMTVQATIASAGQPTPQSTNVQTEILGN